MKQTPLKKTLLASSIALTLGTAHVEAALVTNVLGTNTTYATDSANLTVLASNGSVYGGWNHVNMVWDGSAFNASSDYTGPGSAANVMLSSTAPFFGGRPLPWTAHDVQMFLPGTYSFDTTIGGGSPESGMLNVTVGAGQLGMHMLWDWQGDLNDDIFVVFNLNSVFGSGLLYSTQTNSKGQSTCASDYTGTITKNCLFDPGGYSYYGDGYGSAGPPIKNQIWMLASTDGNGDGVMGMPMGYNAYQGFSFNFSAFAPTTVPIPATAWLFGSGLLGLVGAARRRRQT